MSTSQRSVRQMTNCHVHVFTANHVPDGFAGIAGPLLRVRPFRLALLPLLTRIDPTPRDRLERYARMLEMSHRGSQAAIFERVRGMYPAGTRFVILPMDMKFMAAGHVRASLEKQHAELEALRDQSPESVVPFAAVDPRREGVVATTIALIEQKGFSGIKLYPPLGYDPADGRLDALYAYAEEHAIPVMAHCSRYGVYFRGSRHPVTAERLPWIGRANVVAALADPELFVPVLDRHPKLKLCLAHFGGQHEWDKYRDGRTKQASWLARIIDMITGGRYENLYTDVSYTVFASERHIHLLNELLDSPSLLQRVLYGSDFYVVEDAELDESTGLSKLESVLGEQRFRTIAVDNPDRYLGPTTD